MDWQAVGYAIAGLGLRVRGVRAGCDGVVLVEGAVGVGDEGVGDEGVSVGAEAERRERE